MEQKLHDSLSQLGLSNITVILNHINNTGGRPVSCRHSSKRFVYYVFFAMQIMIFILLKQFCQPIKFDLDYEANLMN